MQKRTHSRLCRVLIACIAVALMRPVFCIEQFSYADDTLQSSVNNKWGDLTGRFVFDGKIPKREKIELNKDVQFCSKHMPLSENLVVNPKTRGLANVVIWLDVRRSGRSPAVHSSYKKTATSTITLKNKACRFDPHICVLRTTQKLKIANVDKIEHSTLADLTRNNPFNEVTGIGASTERKIQRAERRPARIACTIHAWMSGWILVKDHPYMVVTDSDGRFRIKNLPVGEWTFQAWHESATSIAKVSIGEKVTEWQNGRFTITVKAGKNELGEIHTESKLFDKK